MIKRGKSILTSRETLNNAKEKLLDPLAIKLANNIEWWEINDEVSGINYESPVVSTGQGETIMMLHGFDSCFLEFRRLVPLLSKNYKIIIPDMFGFGFCPRPSNANYGKEAIISHLIKILSQLNNKKSIGLIGASMGGGIALELARRCPNKINRLLLLSPAGLTGEQKKLPPLIDMIGVWFLSQPCVRRSLCKQAFANPKVSVGEAEEQIASIHLAMPGWKESLATFARGGGLAACGYPLPPPATRSFMGIKRSNFKR